jgi:type VII secretion integral membrane protein EccD
MRAAAILSDWERRGMAEGHMAAITTDTGLARVVVVTPKRRLEIALPEDLPVAALLPTLLRQGGPELATDGLASGGWDLRRSDGSALSGAKTLAEQSVLDGEVLHLRPRFEEWPEPEYDDLVETIAAGARRAGPPWTKATTRTCGLAVTAGTLCVMPLVALASGPSWLVPAIAELVLAVLILIGGVILSRALADSVAGAVVAASGLPNAFVGGLLILGGHEQVSRFGAPHLLVGSSSLLLVALLGYFGVAETRRLFVAGILTGIAGAIGAGIGVTNVGPSGGAAIVATLLLLFGPVFPILSVRLTKVPTPPVPRDAQDLRDSEALPQAELVMARVAGSSETLAGLLLGAAVTTVCCIAALAVDHSVVSLLLALTISACYILRARMLVAIRQRLAPLVGGIIGLAVTILGIAVMVPEWARISLLAPALALIAVLTGAAAIAYSRRAPSPRLGSFADFLDVVLTLAVCPLTAALLGLFHTIRGLAG